MNYLHVGLGKTGTTFLQNEVFPKIAKIKNIKYIEKKNFVKIFPPTTISNRKLIHSYNFKKLNIQFREKNYFLSAESLCGKLFNPLFWKKSALINKKIFDKDTTVIITLSKPEEFISSIYCQAIQVYSIKNEEEFFLNHKNSLSYLKKYKKNDFFDIELFDYKYLISLYLENFQKVLIIKKEDLKEVNKLKKIFNIKEDLYFTKKVYNKSYSEFSVKLTFIFEKFLNFFGTNLKSTDLFARQINKNNKVGIFKKILNRLSVELRWRYFVQNRLDKFFKFKKYKIKSQKIILQAKRNNDFYEKLESGYISIEKINNL